MAESPAASWGRGPFQAALLIGWMALSAAGVGYARIKNVPSAAALPVIAAFLITYPFYLVPAFPTVRDRLAGWRLPVWLLASAVLPYLAGCLGGVQFTWSGLARLVALALVLGFWFAVLPAGAATDLAFLAVIPYVLLSKYLTSIYLPIDPKLKDVVFLGHIALIQMAVMVLLVKRRVPDPGYGFLPKRHEWQVGVLHFLYFAPVGLALAWLMKLLRLGKPAAPWLIAGSFIGFLWTVALSEEFLIWGVLQNWLRTWSGRPTVAIFGASAVFGLIHLGFRGFPNWRWVILAGVLGWFCGRARNQAGSIRAGMVTHALVFTAWRAFFTAW